MFRSHSPGQPDADSAARNVSAAFRKRSGDTILAEDDLLHCSVVGAHGQNHVGHPADIGWCIGPSGTINYQRLRLLPASIIYGYLVTGTKQVPRHRGPHTAQSNETNFHNS